jgi:hypothetical protein
MRPIFVRVAISVIIGAGIFAFSTAQKVESWSYNKDGFYATGLYPIPKQADYAKYFSVSADFVSLSACFYKVYYTSVPSTSKTVNTVMQTPGFRHATIGYVMYYWKDGQTEQDAITNNWRKLIDPNLECKNFNLCCDVYWGINTPRKCGAQWAIEEMYDWRQNSLQCITLGNLAENTRYHFKVYFWTCLPTNASSITDGYLSESHYPPKYEILRNQQATPIIHWDVWIEQGTIVTGKKPPVPTGGNGQIRPR